MILIAGSADCWIIKQSFVLESHPDIRFLLIYIDILESHPDIDSNSYTFLAKIFFQNVDVKKRDTQRRWRDERHAI